VYDKRRGAPRRRSVKGVSALEISVQRFAGKTVVVTGAGAGIGRATALRLAQEGARVIAVDLDKERLSDLELGASGLRLVGDVTDGAVVERIFSQCTGRLDGLANIAGIMDGFLPVGEVDDATWEHVFSVNVTGVMRCSRAAIPLMAAGQGGSIVNVASEAALRGSAGGAAYTASKHAIVGLTKSTAFMYRSSGVRANVVAPGGVRTSIQANPRSELGFGAVAKVLGAVMPPIAEPEELAAAITWLLSDEARNISGAVLASDGGWCAI
jgi:NAD(P)-dependent dehydrogenase (short-subunit alcohol dehydrogenase family)